MTFAAFCWGVGSEAENYERNLFKQLAFLGRYAHQNVADMMRMSVRSIRLLAEATSELIKDEKDQIQSTIETSGP